MKWGKIVGKSVFDFDCDIVSICTQPEQQNSVMDQLVGIKGIWCEKPYVSKGHPPDAKVQVNYLRRADPFHRTVASAAGKYADLIVYGKDDETTRCHFRDLSRWWNVPLDYRPFIGPCAYLLRTKINDGPKWSAENTAFFDNGGIHPGECMVGMLTNLLDAMDNGTELWSPPYVE